MSDWGAKPETIAFFANLTGPSGYDPENTVKRLSYMQTRGMHIEGMSDRSMQEDGEVLVPLSML